MGRVQDFVFTCITANREMLGSVQGLTLSRVELLKGTDLSRQFNFLSDVYRFVSTPFFFYTVRCLFVGCISLLNS